WIRIDDAVAASESAKLGDTDLGAAEWAQRHGQATGRYTDTLAGSAWWFLPLRNDRETLGVIGLRFATDHARLAFEQQRLAEAMADDIGQAALRTRLVSDLETARVGNETERL